MEDKTVILDGGMGTMLQQSGMAPGHIPELVNIEDPSLIQSIHKKYIEAGSDIIYTATFGANRFKLGDKLEKVVKAAMENAKIATEGTDTKIALDIGPLGTMVEPIGSLSFEEAYGAFKEIILYGKDQADYIVLETMTDLYELKAAILAAKENSDLPILATMSFEEDGRTFFGVSIETFVNMVSGLGVQALGINCSLGPGQMEEMVGKLAEISPIDLIIKPNAGLPKSDGSYDMSREEFADLMERLWALGVKYLGGCCGTDDSYIRLLKAKFKGKNYIKRDNIRPVSLASSATRLLPKHGLIRAGERLNPTGKKRFQQALIDEDMDYIISQAVAQVDEGAHILDVNVGYPGIDEPKMQKQVIKAIQSVTDIPLMIDSSKASALEAGLRAYNGKAIVNSVTGEEDKLDEVLGLVKKYNAQVIGLPIDESGLGKTAEKRLEIARKILDKALEYGISKDDIYIDCLALTIGSEEESAITTLETIKQVKDQLGLKTCLGLSNISFGLANRDLINASFLSLCIYQGLDLAIINTGSEPVMDAIRATEVLLARDGALEAYLGAYTGKRQEKPSEKSTYTLEEAVYKGLKDEVKKLVKKALKTRDELDIVDENLIPALDLVGDDYQEGKIFLPQLIKSAQAAQEGFALIRESISQKGGQAITKGQIIIATVKGDIHDIGKNIAKVILENYGYKVYDMGKDVPIEDIIKEAKKRNIKLIGLSALMTTSLDSMEETIKEIKSLDPTIKIMVGGAVLTGEYAKTIGADYYLQDAKANVLVADEIFGEDNDK